MEQTAFWQGPLPPPAILEDFRRLVPDAPERIFRQWEREAEHRRAYEMTALNGGISQNRVGQIAAIAFALAALLTTGFLGYLGHSVAAGVVGGTTTVGVVTAFLAQRIGKKAPK